MFYKIMLFLLIFALGAETAFAAKTATCQGKYGANFPFCCIDFTTAAYQKNCPASDLKCWQFADGFSCNDTAKAVHGIISSACTLTTPVNGHAAIFDSYCQKSSDNPSGYKLKLEK